MVERGEVQKRACEAHHIGIEGLKHPVQRGRPKRPVLVGSKRRAAAPASLPRRGERQVTHLAVLEDGGGGAAKVASGGCTPLVGEILGDGGPVMVVSASPL